MQGIDVLKSSSFEDLNEDQRSIEQTQAELENKKAIRKDAILSTIIDAFSSLIRTRPTQAAASISYYALFSVFPLILFVVVILSYFIEYTVIQKEIILLLENIIPGSETYVIENLQNILNNRTSTSIAASITLLWSSSRAFNGIISNIHRAWPESKGRGYFVNRFFAILGIIAIIVFLVALTVFSVAINFSELVPLFDFQINQFVQFLMNLVVGTVLPIVLVYFSSYLLYYYVPTVDVDKKAAQIGALVTSLTLKIFTGIFGLYILSPLNRYDLVYGSVTTIILMLLYVYFCTFIILFSAHLVAAITHYKLKKGIPTSFQQKTVLLSVKPSGKKVPVTKKKRKSLAEISDEAGDQFAKWVEAKIVSIAAKRPNLRSKINELNAADKTDQIQKAIKNFFGTLFRWK